MRCVDTVQSKATILTQPTADFYHLWFPRDASLVKSLGIETGPYLLPITNIMRTVYSVLVYEWIQTTLITQAAFDTFVYGFGDVTVLTQFHNTWFSVTIMGPIISSVVQCYFAHRTWILARSRVLTAIIVIVRRHSSSKARTLTTR